MSSTRRDAAAALAAAASLGVDASGPAPLLRAAASVFPLASTTARLAYERISALDLDGDGRITAHDAEQAHRRQQRFAVDLEFGPGLRVELAGAERLAHVADVLAEEILTGRGDVPGLPWERMLERRTAAFRQLIERSWDGLVRRSDRVEELEKAVQAMPVRDPEGRPRVYVPTSDPRTLKRLRTEARRAGMEVVALGKQRDEATWRQLMRRPGVLYLPRPYLVPGGRFVQMFGWDSYFMGRGALACGRYDLARNLLETYLYEIEHYGRIPNSSISIHLSRTQPPLMPRLALELHAVEPDLRLLARVARAGIRELQTIFLGDSRRTASGLSRYKDDAEGPDAEDMANRYVYRPDDPEFHRHDRAIRESGWDMCHRFGTATHHHEPVCLNSLLHQYERDLARILRLLEGERSSRALAFEDAARARARLMRKRFWDDARGMFFDFNFVQGQRTRYETLATFYPLWTGWATREEAAAVAASLPRFLEAGGLATSSRASREAAGGEDLQWDWPFGWAPLQLIAVEGLRRYGFNAEADAIAYRWLSMLMDVAGGHNGILVEKYDVVRRSADVPVEYGNQGADRGPYLTPRSERSLGFGWTNASVPLLLDGLSAELRQALDAGHPAEAALVARGSAARQRARA